MLDGEHGVIEQVADGRLLALARKDDQRAAFGTRRPVRRYTHRIFRVCSWLLCVSSWLWSCSNASEMYFRNITPAHIFIFSRIQMPRILSAVANNSASKPNWPVRFVFCRFFSQNVAPVLIFFKRGAIR